MRGFHRAGVAAGLAAASVLVLVACATPSGAGGGAPFGAVPPAPPAGGVTATGVVMEAGGDVQLCLGPVAESYPPQCRGIPIEGWSWDGVDGSESSGDVRWGAYAVAGGWDGETLTVDGPPIMLALYDPMPLPDPTGGEPGSGDPAELESIQEELPSRLGDLLVSSHIENGWLWVDVVWDDGSLQKAADAEFGDGAVVVRSALRG